ncbi:MAG: GtrA family protein [Planctomycetota bacterium]
MIKRLVPRQYAKFFVVGVGVTLATIALRALLGWLIDDSTLLRYQGTILAAYLFGIVVGIYAHKAFTFSYSERLGVSHFLRFGAVQLIGLLTVTLLAALLREITDAAAPEELSKTLAFMIASLAVSVQTYLLNKRLVFVPAKTTES